MYGNMWRGRWGNHMIKQVFRCTKEWLLGEPLVKIETGGKWFTTKFDPETQSFKHFDHEGKEIDWTDAREVAKKISEVI